MIRHSLALSLFAALLAAPGITALADTVSITATNLAFTPSADSLSLAANTTTFSPGTSFTLQTGTYTVGDSGTLTGSFPYTFVEDVTLDGITQAVTFSATNLVTNALMANTDFLTISATSTYFPGLNTYLITEQYVSPAFSVGGVSAVTLTAATTSAVTPEPSAWLLMGTGLLSMVLLRRILSTRPNGLRL